MERKDMGLCTIRIIRLLNIFGENGIKGKSLCMMGKQYIHIEWGYFIELVNRFKVYYRKDIYEQIKNIMPVDAYKFFEMFGFSSVHAVDISEYEGADIILDLNADLPEGMKEKFDYVIDGGTLEHVFDAPRAISNMSQMVKKNGIIIHMVPLGGYVDHGFYSFSPGFFMDFYSANSFEISKSNFYLIKIRMLNGMQFIRKIVVCFQIGWENEELMII